MMIELPLQTRQSDQWLSVKKLLSGDKKKKKGFAAQFSWFFCCTCSCFKHLWCVCLAPWEAPHWFLKCGILRVVLQFFSHCSAFCFVANQHDLGLGHVLAKWALAYWCHWLGPARAEGLIHFCTNRLTPLCKSDSTSCSRFKGLSSSTGLQTNFSGLQSDVGPWDDPELIYIWCKTCFLLQDPKWSKEWGQRSENPRETRVASSQLLPG